MNYKYRSLDYSYKIESSVYRRRLNLIILFLIISQISSYAVLNPAQASTSPYQIIDRNNTKTIFSSSDMPPSTETTSTTLSYYTGTLYKWLCWMIKYRETTERRKEFLYGHRVSDSSCESGGTSTTVVHNDITSKLEWRCSVDLYSRNDQTNRRYWLWVDDSDCDDSEPNMTTSSLTSYATSLPTTITTTAPHPVTDPSTPWLSETTSNSIPTTSDTSSSTLVISLESPSTTGPNSSPATTIRQCDYLHRCTVSAEIADQIIRIPTWETYDLTIRSTGLDYLDTIRKNRNDRIGRIYGAALVNNEWKCYQRTSVWVERPTYNYYCEGWLLGSGLTKTTIPTFDIKKRINFNSPATRPPMTTATTTIAADFQMAPVMTSSTITDHSEACVFGEDENCYLYSGRKVWISGREGRVKWVLSWDPAERSWLSCHVQYRVIKYRSTTYLGMQPYVTDEFMDIEPFPVDLAICDDIRSWPPTKRAKYDPKYGINTSFNRGASPPQLPAHPEVAERIIMIPKTDRINASTLGYTTVNDHLVCYRLYYYYEWVYFLHLEGNEWVDDYCKGWLLGKGIYKGSSSSYDTQATSSSSISSTSSTTSTISNSEATLPTITNTSSTHPVTEITTNSTISIHPVANPSTPVVTTNPSVGTSTSNTISTVTATTAMSIPVNSSTTLTSITSPDIIPPTSSVSTGTTQPPRTSSPSITPTTVVPTTSSINNPFLHCDPLFDPSNCYFSYGETGVTTDGVRFIVTRLKIWDTEVEEWASCFFEYREFLGYDNLGGIIDMQPLQKDIEYCDHIIGSNSTISTSTITVSTTNTTSHDPIAPNTTKHTISPVTGSTFQTPQTTASTTTLIATNGTSIPNPNTLNTASSTSSSSLPSNSSTTISTASECARVKFSRCLVSVEIEEKIVLIPENHERDYFRYQGRFGLGAANVNGVWKCYVRYYGGWTLAYSPPRQYCEGWLLGSGRTRTTHPIISVDPPYTDPTNSASVNITSTTTIINVPSASTVTRSITKESSTNICDFREDDNCFLYQGKSTRNGPDGRISREKPNTYWVLSWDPVGKEWLSCDVQYRSRSDIDVIIETEPSQYDLSQCDLIRDWPPILYSNKYGYPSPPPITIPSEFSEQIIPIPRSALSNSNRQVGYAIKNSKLTCFAHTFYGERYWGNIFDSNDEPYCEGWLQGMGLVTPNFYSIYRYRSNNKYVYVGVRWAENGKIEPKCYTSSNPRIHEWVITIVPESVSACKNLARRFDEKWQPTAWPAAPNSLFLSTTTNSSTTTTLYLPNSNTESVIRCDLRYTSGTICLQFGDVRLNVYSPISDVASYTIEEYYLEYTVLIWDPTSKGWFSCYDYSVPVEGEEYSPIVEQPLYQESVDDCIQWRRNDSITTSSSTSVLNSTIATSSSTTMIEPTTITAGNTTSTLTVSTSTSPTIPSSTLPTAIPVSRPGTTATSTTSPTSTSSSILEVVTTISSTTIPQVVSPEILVASSNQESQSAHFTSSVPKRSQTSLIPSTRPQIHSSRSTTTNSTIDLSTSLPVTSSIANPAEDTNYVVSVGLPTSTTTRTNVQLKFPATTVVPTSGPNPVNIAATYDTISESIPDSIPTQILDIANLQNSNSERDSLGFASIAPRTFTGETNQPTNSYRYITTKLRDNIQVIVEETGGNQNQELATPEFTDLLDTTHQQNIVQLAQLGIAQGCNPPLYTQYCPDRTITRGEIATLLTRALNLPTTNTDHFTDDTTNTHHQHINQLAQAGITQGCNQTNTHYCPNRPVTRAEIATLLTRALNLPTPTQPNPYTDTHHNTHQQSINAITQAGITQGCYNNNYCPNRPVTRAEMATFLIKAINHQEITKTNQ